METHRLNKEKAQHALHAYLSEKSETPLPDLESTPVKTEPYPHTFMSLDLLEQWGDGISETECKDQPTPLVPLDLTPEGYGNIFVKDESNRNCNPTGTFKDRLARSIVRYYKTGAQNLYVDMRSGKLNKNKLENIAVPRISLLSSGNEAMAIAHVCKKYNFPPLHLLMEKNTPQKRLGEIKKLYTNLYLTELGKKELTSAEIEKLTENDLGSDITLGGQHFPLLGDDLVYRQLFEEITQENPDEIYLPYGSGRLMINFISAPRNNQWEGKPVSREMIEKYMRINILGAEPSDPHSSADKLTAPFKPFRQRHDDWTAFAKHLGWTGKESGRCPVSEQRIHEAHKLMHTHDISAEPSGATGLALYLERFAQGVIPKDAKVIVLNSGAGVLSKLERLPKG